MWTCALCETKNENNTVCRKCGYDRSLDYGKYRTLSQLNPTKMREYEQQMSKNTAEHELVTWAKSVQADIDALDAQTRKEIIRDIQANYKTLIYNARLKSQKIKSLSASNLNPVKKNNEIGNNKIEKNSSDAWNEKRFLLNEHNKKVKFKGTLMDAFVIGGTCEIVNQSYMKMTEAQRWNYEGNCWYFGNGRRKNYEKAVECYRKAEKFGNMNAVNNLGNCYYYGNGVTTDYDMAIEYYRKAAEKMNVAATYNLAYCYLTGTGTKKNKELANTLYQRAEVYNSVQQRNKG